MSPTPCTYLQHCQKAARPPRFEDPSGLAILGKEMAASLREAGHSNLLTVALADIPDVRRRRAVRAVQQGQAIIEPEAAILINNLAYPRHTLRIDTIGFAQPIWPGTRPYQVIPFQWTCDIETAEGQVERHTFLATDPTDPRRSFAESLLNALGDSGPILAYNAGFETNRLRELARVFEDLAGPIEALLPRVVDLFQVARGHCYHPQMCGSWSFKSLVRAFVPQAQADAFAWQGITEAQEAYAHSLLGRLDAQSLASVRQALLAYGQRQTEALRLFVQCLARSGPPEG